MAYTETQTVGYGTRVGNSFKGIGMGIIMFLAGTVLLWWNEGRFVKTDKMLNEAQGKTEELATIDRIDPEMDGQLVYATGVATTKDSLTDADFGFGATAVRLQRTVEYFQWVEHEKQERKDKMGGSEEIVTTYTYERAWVDQPVQSESFKDPEYQKKNFVLTTVEPMQQQAETVKFGAFVLNQGQISRIHGDMPLNVKIDSAKLVSMNKDTRRLIRAKGIQVDDSTACVYALQNTLYYGANPSNPAVGDVRVTWTMVKPENKITIIAKQKDNTFTNFKAKNGKSFSTLVMGTKDVDEIYESEHDENSMIVWILRIVGIFIVIGGLKGIFGFLETILKVVPFIANIFGWGVGVVCTVIGVVWSLIIIALAWLFYRPVIGIALLAIAGFLVWVFAFKGKDKLKELAAMAKNKAAEARVERDNVI